MYVMYVIDVFASPPNRFTSDQESIIILKTLSIALDSINRFPKSNPSPLLQFLAISPI